MQGSVDAIYLDFRKTFDIATCNFLTIELGKPSLGKSAL